MYYDIKKAKYIKENIIHVIFETGEAFDVNLKPFIRGEIFEPLKDINFFKKFFIESGVISWPNGADIAPETLYEYAKGNHKFTA